MFNYMLIYLTKKEDIYSKRLHPTLFFW